MTVTNHMLAGSFIAIAVKQPLLALPLAAASHFILDALPHFGYRRGSYTEMFKHRLAYVVSAFDVIGVLLLCLTVLSQNWIIFAGALLAALPDISWPYRYYYYERHGHLPPESAYTRFHYKIQWCERPWALIIEALFFVALFMLIGRYIAA
ncbi:MAG: hypothetical protein JWP13_532 [Candidatus Saccharibacteria bacterium]|nr:hypothetical protein [Candidatus Saccharibacteria bacterium]